MRTRSVPAPARTSGFVVAVVLALCTALLLPTQAVATSPVASAAAAETGANGGAEGGEGLSRPAWKPAPQHYRPPAGLKTNNPLGSKARRTEINRHLLRLINSVPGSHKIRIASWNIRSWAFIDALTRAHKRGVSVRIVVDRGNAKPENPNAQVDKLQRVLNGWGNKQRTGPYRSKLTRCRSACRGPRGIAHTKFFLFSRVGGGIKHVVVNGSHNMTDVAARAQWNDVYTIRGRQGIYDQFEMVFGQMLKDKNVHKRFVSSNFGGLTTYFHPYGGPGATGDPVLRRLNQTSCNAAGGKTKLRIAMTSWHGKRGISIAKRIRTMHNRGCNVKIIYAVMGNGILWWLRRAGSWIPHRQITQDPDGDGVYNRYLHMKVLTIAGNYRGNRNARVVFTGSENWSPAAIPSDEAGFRIYGAGLVARYNNWIDYLYANPPYRRSSRVSTRSGVAARGTAEVLEVPPAQRTPAEVEKVARARGVDPYALIEVD